MTWLTIALILSDWYISGAVRRPRCRLDIHSGSSHGVERQMSACRCDYVMIEWTICCYCKSQHLCCFPSGFGLDLNVRQCFSATTLTGSAAGDSALDKFNNSWAELNDWLSLLDHMVQTQKVTVGDLDDIKEMTAKLKVRPWCRHAFILFRSNSSFCIQIQKTYLLKFKSTFLSNRLYVESQVENRSHYIRL